MKSYAPHWRTEALHTLIDLLDREASKEECLAAFPERGDLGIYSKAKQLGRKPVWRPDWRKNSPGRYRTIPQMDETIPTIRRAPYCVNVSDLQELMRVERRALQLMEGKHGNGF